MFLIISKRNKTHAINEGLCNSQCNFSSRKYRDGYLREPHVRIWKLKIKLDKDTTEKKYRLIKETDLQPYIFKNMKKKWFV